MTTLPLAEVRANLSRIVDEAVTTHERVEITRNGVRVAVVLSTDDYDTMIETLDVLGDTALVTDIRAALDDSDVTTTAELLASLPSGRRPQQV